MEQSRAVVASLVVCGHHRWPVATPLVTKCHDSFDVVKLELVQIRPGWLSGPLVSGHVTRVRVVCGDEAGGGVELQLARPGGGEGSEFGALGQKETDEGDESLLVSVLADSRATVCVLVSSFMPGQLLSRCAVMKSVS